jgi:hypothetical protein
VRDRPGSTCLLPLLLSNSSPGPVARIRPCKCVVGQKASDRPRPPRGDPSRTCSRLPVNACCPGCCRDCWRGAAANARRELALKAAIAKLDKYHLLILDDLAYVTKDQAENQRAP